VPRGIAFWLIRCVYASINRARPISVVDISLVVEVVTASNLESRSLFSDLLQGDLNMEAWHCFLDKGLLREAPKHPLVVFIHHAEGI
jgi:hypothetical protein